MTDLDAAWETYAFEARLRAMLEVSPFASTDDRALQRERAEQAYRVFTAGFLEICHRRPAMPDRGRIEGYLLGLKAARQLARDYRVDEALRHAEPSGAAAAAKAIDLKITDLIEVAHG